MKNFIRTIVVLVVLNLAIGSFALAQNASEKADLEAAKKEMEVAKEEMKKAGQKMKGAMPYEMSEIAKRLEEAIPPQISGVGRSRSLTDRHDGSGPVLVIPAAEIKVKDLVTIMEDMSVMSRILDKKKLAPMGRMMQMFGNMPFARRGAFLRDNHETESIYLDGYGALFLIKVDFPLSPPPEAEEKEAEEELDTVWEQTKREIYTPEDVRRETRRRRSEQRQQYDAEKVEELKTRLIKALKHAANIRNLKPSESIITTVTGEGDQTGRTIRLLIKRDTIGDDEDKEVRVYEAPSSEEMSFPSTTVMTIRVKKSDVDAFAKGELDFDKFRQKVQIFTY